MYVKNHILEKNKLTTVSLDESIGSVLKKINEGDFLSLPVLEGEEFKGIIMKEAIFRYYFEQGCMKKSEFLNDVKVKDLYNKDYKFIRENELIENASYLLNEFRTPFLPVLNSRDEFVGILTHSSIFNAFAEVFGFDKGTRIVVNIFDTPGQLAKLTEIIRKEGVNIVNLAVMDAKVLDVFKVVIRVNAKNVDELVEKISKAGFRVGEVTDIDE